MRSTFMGLEASKRGLFTQQSALYTTGHNISNANTEGYSRQRVNMQTTLPYPGVGLNSPKTAGYIGTGVEATSVQRYRDQFVDRQFRQEENKLGYWTNQVQNLTQMEDILSEPSEYGLGQAFSEFWSSIQDVSTNPEDAAARKVAVQKAQHIADSFQYIDKQLKMVQSNIGNELNVSTAEINSLLKQIAEINRQVQASEPNGYVPNDLYDARDVLIDRLNEFVPVAFDRVPSGGNALDVAEGSYTVYYTTATGERVDLIDGRNYTQLNLIGNTGETVNGDNLNNLFSEFTYTELADYETHYRAAQDGIDMIVEGSLVYEDFTGFKGSIISMIDSFGHTNINGEPVGYYPNMLAKLDTLANVFATTFNEVHQQGYALKDNTSTTGLSMFESSVENTPISASNIKVIDEMMTDTSLFAASSKQGEEGNGNWALTLSNLQFKALTGEAQVGADGTNVIMTSDLDGATFESFYQSMIGQLAVDTREADTVRFNSETLKLTISNNRASMSSVSLDEEMTNMITFQQAYNANARMLTAIDEMLDKIINGLGRVGL
ncbi:flagellar hook-associated protein FlgK [Caryophanon tenue]|uniref:Flagellar hook-associated protein 1 n=1 Tax=Caryophanon tenue TaxID=33978 RepID=A0A1C0YJU9_9BACL|nr:flagellar hook-associated protein FlgK [Caryophanon tenue]OCS87423.1 flagellar hook-associated protein FlgK [Caryophanon tenue]